MRSDVFEDVKAAVTVPEIARFYGYEPNRAGFICCPFHSEKTPSMKLYDRNFHCFGCGVNGSVIDFVGMLFNLEPLEAVKRINADFRLDLPLDRPPDQEQLTKREQTKQARELFEAWRERMLLQLNAAIRTANTADFPSLSESERMAVIYRESLEAWADALQNESLETQMKIFRAREEVERLCKQILSDTQTKS